MRPSPEQLDSLVGEGKVDELLNLVSFDDIADAWWRSRENRREDNNADDPDFWAVELWLGGGPIWAHEDHLRRGILALLERMPHPEDVGALGAGPVEDCIHHPDESRLRWVEEQAARSATFRAALAYVWIEYCGPEVFLRVERAAGTDLIWHADYGLRPMHDGSFVDPENHRVT